MLLPTLSVATDCVLVRVVITFPYLCYVYICMYCVVNGLMAHSECIKIAIICKLEQRNGILLWFHKASFSFRCVESAMCFPSSGLESTVHMQATFTIPHIIRSQPHTQIPTYHRGNLFINQRHNHRILILNIILPFVGGA